MKKIIISFIVLLATLNCNAVDIIRGAVKGASHIISRADINVRLGYNLGGTAPLGMPASIRSLNSFTLQFNPCLGIDVAYPIAPNFYAQVGLQLENKGMQMDANVKNYHMEIEHGGEKLAGMFTGDVTTKVAEWMLTLPVQASYKYKNVNFKLGPYVSYVGSRNFSGWAHNGYLRYINPTGDKIVLGEAAGERGDYDFTPDMRRWQVGVDLGVDWHFHHRFGAFADLTWGMSRVHKPSFTTIEQSLYPIYGKVGLTYRLK